MRDRLESEFHTDCNLTAEGSHYAGSFGIEVFQLVLAACGNIAEVYTANEECGILDEAGLVEKILVEVVVELDIAELQIRTVTLPECACPVVVGVGL